MDRSQLVERKKLERNGHQIKPVDSLLINRKFGGERHSLPGDAISKDHGRL